MNTIFYYLTGIRGLIKQRAAQQSFPLDFVAEELIRNTHSIEKGLCISTPRLGFGHKKQEVMIQQISQLKDSTKPLHQCAVYMALDAMKEYLEFHEAQSYSDEFIEKMRQEVDSHSSLMSKEKIGGTLLLKKADLDKINTEAGEYFIQTRHSIRDFSDEDVSDARLEKALLLAQKAPSACNRQGVRAYIICGDQLKDLAKRLPDIGGFAEAAKRVIVITGKINAYRTDEINQYIVSASMYAAYLTLTLHLYGMGACVVQRPVVWTKTWDELRRKWGIDGDEQIVCMLTVGNLKDSCKVPLSNRLGEDIYKFIR